MWLASSQMRRRNVKKRLQGKRNTGKLVMFFSAGCVPCVGGRAIWRTRRKRWCWFIFWLEDSHVISYKLRDLGNLTDERQRAIATMRDGLDTAAKELESTYSQVLDVLKEVLRAELDLEVPTFCVIGRNIVNRLLVSACSSLARSPQRQPLKQDEDRSKQLSGAQRRRPHHHSVPRRKRSLNSCKV